jgi:hypothetical protein
MANLVEKVDYNADRDFGSADLDISWAYLQTKKLYELEQIELASNPNFTTTISLSNWVSKVREQYELNMTSGIAETSTAAVTDLPGYLKNEVPTADLKVSFEALWTCNDIYNGSKTWTETSTLLDSVSLEETGTLSSCSWETESNQRLLKLPSTWSSIKFNHNGKLNNHKSWILYIKGKIKNLNDSRMFWLGDMWKIQLYTDYIVLIGSSNGKTWCRWPSPRDSYAGKDLEVYLVKDGIEVSIYLNGVLAEKTSPQSQPEYISMSDAESEPLVISGKTWEYIDTVFITDNLLDANFVVNASNQYVGEPLAFKYKTQLSQVSTFFASGQYIQDRYANFGRLLNGFPAYDTSAGGATPVTWFPETSGGTSNGYVPNERMLMLIKTSKSKKLQYLKVGDFNFSGNFTIGFWVRTPARASKFLTIHSATDDKSFGVMYSSSGTSFGLVMPGKSGWNSFSSKKDNVLPSGTAATDDWQYVTVVKNGNVVGLWLNGEYCCTSTISDADNIAMGSNELRLNSTSSGSAYYSDLTILSYAISQVPSGTSGLQSSYPFIDELKTKETAS